MTLVGCRDGLNFQDVVHIRQAFEGLRDESDPANEISLAKLQMFPFFTRQDLARLA